MFLLSLVVLYSALGAMASGYPWNDFHRGGQSLGCSLRNAKLPGPAAKDFKQQRGEAHYPKVLALGVGVQNYTCSSAGVYA